MKKMFFLTVLLSLTLTPLSSQKAKTILEKYTEVTGGEKNWDKVQSLTAKGTAKLISQGGMELPFLRIMKADGKQITSLKINGMDYISIAFDGKVAWGSNQQMQSEDKDADVTKNTKLLEHDFPYPGHKWKDRGYQVAYLGKEKVNEIETHKIRLIKRPQWVEGKEVENVLTLYFDVEKNVPILTEYVVMTGVDKGKIMKSFLSDYKNVDGYLYPFTVTMKYEDETFQILETESVEWNSEINDNIFLKRSNLNNN